MLEVREKLPTARIDLLAGDVAVGIRVDLLEQGEEVPRVLSQLRGREFAPEHLRLNGRQAGHVHERAAAGEERTRDGADPGLHRNDALRLVELVVLLGRHAPVLACLSVDLPLAPGRAQEPGDIRSGSRVTIVCGTSGHRRTVRTAMPRLTQVIHSS
jgi:hypothetical protein